MDKNGKNLILDWIKFIHIGLLKKFWTQYFNSTVWNDSTSLLGWLTEIWTQWQPIFFGFFFEVKFICNVLVSGIQHNDLIFVYNTEWSPQ